jgi:preprotein translocase subunit SecD
MRRAFLAAACAVTALAAAACDDEPELHDALRLKALPQEGHKLTDEDLDRSVEIIRHRLARLGVDGEVRRLGMNMIVVAVPASVQLSDEQAGVLVKTGLLEFYDFEAVVRGQIAQPNPPAAVPPGTVVVSCMVAAGTCLSTRPLTGKKAFYLFRNAPAMTGRDLNPSGTRAALDPSSSQPVVVVQFTARGKHVFHEITRREAKRGARACSGRRSLADVMQCSQHFAIVLDHQIVTLPYVDFVRNPDGIPGDNGAQIVGAGGSLREAKRLAIALQTGALPVRLVRLR